MSDLEEAEEAGHVSRVPHVSSARSYFGREDATATPQRFVGLRAAPLAGAEPALAIDSAGFSGAGHLRRFDEEDGRPRQQARWVEPHAVAGANTSAVGSCRVLDEGTGDGTQLAELLTDTAERLTVGEPRAGKAYTSRANFDAVEAAGGTFYPAVRKDAAGGAGGAYGRALHLMSLNEGEYQPHYHKRSNAESSFRAVERLLGSAPRSNTELARVNEALAKAVCFDVTCVIHATYELGIDPEFVTRPRCTAVEPAAQRLA